MPNNWGIVTGAVDAYAFEKIEVIRGANGLLTGVGNAAGTVNDVRKRPTNTAQGHAALYYGDFDRARVEADYSTPLTASGSWAGRLVAAGEKSGSYLRGLNNDRHLIYGVVDGQVGRDGSLAVGLQYQRTNTQGNMWGALNFSHNDGTQAEYDVSASTAVDWTNWDTETHTAFVEYVHALSSDWQVRTSYNFRDYEDDNYLFYTYAPDGLDPLTGEGLIGWPGSWPTRDWARLLDLNLSGQFDAWGMSHQAVLGASYGYSKNNQYTRPSDSNEPAWGSLPGFPYAGDARLVQGRAA